MYIPPDGNKERAEDVIASVAVDIEETKPDAAVVITGDFKGGTPRDTLPFYTQYV